MCSVPKQYYSVPEWFLKHKLKVRADNAALDTTEIDLRDKLQSAEDGDNNETALASDSTLNSPDDTKPRANVVKSEEKDLGSSSSSTGGKSEVGAIPKPPAKYEVLHDSYLELRDTTADTLVCDGEGKLISSQSSILLSSGPQSNDEFFELIVAHLARDLNADLISLDLGDLEDMGQEFDRQRVEQKLAKAKEEKDRQDENDGKNKQGEKVDKDEESQDEVEEEPDRKEAFSFAKFYFDHPRKGDMSETASERYRAATSAILASPRKDSELHGKEGTEDNPSGIATMPVFLFVQNANQIMEQSRGYRYLSRLREVIEERREAGEKILLFVSITTGQPPFKKTACRPECEICDTDGPTSEETDLKEKLSVKSEHTFVFDKDNFRSLLGKDESKERHKSVIQTLRRALRAKLLGRNVFFSPDLLAPYPDEDFADSQEIRDILKDAKLTEADARRIANQVSGRVVNKTTLEVEDIVTVMKRVLRKGDMKDDDEKKDGSSKAFEDRVEKIREDCNTFEEGLLASLVNPSQLRLTYDDVILDEETKSTVKQLIAISKFQSKGASKGLLDKLRIKGALFYGPPGTGKTHLTRAIAKESGTNLLTIDGASIHSKWIGESEKYIRAAFTLCQKLHPCILFIDEGDSLFYRRSPDDRSWERNNITQFLQQMDGLATSDKSPFVIVATNRPSDLDDAFLRRLPQKIQFPLPSITDRAKIMRLHLKDEEIDASIDIDGIARATEDFSGADLRTLCGQAALVWAAEGQDADKSGSNGEVGKNLLNARHFAKALRRTRPSISRRAMKETNEFATKFNSTLN